MKVVRVRMEVGEICLINMEQLTFLIEMFARDTIAGDMEFSRCKGGDQR